ncbi:hypothetical protein GUJ93_ZPchr0005g14759 [Zizania palustris]|uniref:Uncharacterized protein n=1 Tax=Zizania palustris TaxID=103762 RepID=A0A8J5S5C3_ZIZPA|nr:hypothetical protein GUJ93_ZPchr0005g14759 [Zizania palustris]
MGRLVEISTTSTDQCGFVHVPIPHGPTPRHAPSDDERRRRAMSMAAWRRALLTHLRVPVARPTAAALVAAGSAPATRLLSTTTEEGAKGSFLDKGEVADRIISVVKNFQKVEPAKVSTAADFFAVP